MRSDVSQMNSPAQGVAGLQGLNRAATPLWMRSDLPAQPSPGSLSPVVFWGVEEGLLRHFYDK